MSRAFIYNGKRRIEESNFRESFNYQLESEVENRDINNLGDTIRVRWFKTIQSDEGENERMLAIEEIRSYTRTETGVEPQEIQVLVKDTEIKFYKYNGETESLMLHRKYNNKDRKERDQKSRNSLLELTREKVGGFIYLKFINEGSPEKIAPALGEAKMIFDNLNKEVNQYKFERLNEPLVRGIKTYLLKYPQNYLTQDVFDYTASVIDVEYYINLE